MTRLTIVCHAATEAVRAARFPDDEAIDDQVVVPASMEAPITAGRWLAGPERRATSTAAALCGDKGITVDRELRDWDCGRWRGQTFSDLHHSEPEALTSWLTDPDAAPHGGESLLDLLARIGRWLYLPSTCETKTVAVAHPAILRAAVVKALDAGPAAFWRIDAQPLSRAQLSHDGRRWALQSLVPPGRMAHLHDDDVRPSV